MKYPLSIKNGRVFVNGKETVDPVLIGYAVLDAAENYQKEHVSINWRLKAVLNSIFKLIGIKHRYFFIYDDNLQLVDFEFKKI